MLNGNAAKASFSVTIHFWPADTMRFISARRWKQFSLGTAFLLLTLLCVLFGPWSDGAHRQRKAVAAISRLGGSVAYRGEVWHDFRRGSWIPIRLKNFIGRDFFDPVTIVYLSSEEFHDSDLGCLEELSDVEEIWIPESITDAGLDHLHGMTKLKEVNLHGSSFTDAGLRKLRGFRELRSFSSRNAKFSDEALRELSRHSKLQHLHLYSSNHRSPITDAGIRHLRPLKNLSELFINGAKISEGAVEDLQRALPQCDVCIYPADDEE